MTGAVNESNLALAVRLLSLPEKIKGYGHVKDRNLAEVRKEQAALLEQFGEPVRMASAA